MCTVCVLQYVQGFTAVYASYICMYKVYNVPAYVYVYILNLAVKKDAAKESRINLTHIILMTELVMTRIDTDCIVYIYC